MIRQMTCINGDLPGVTVGILTDEEYEAIKTTFAIAGFESYAIPNGMIYRGQSFRGKPSPVAVVTDEPEPPLLARCAHCRRVVRTNDPLHEVKTDAFTFLLCGDCLNKFKHHVKVHRPNAVVV